ncbi:MAG: VOC family protein [Bacteroidia bacterium]|nr:VOC family protein [Bacteroidia bacterium]MDW8134657.1 VOC family protein [Bacteroidia bacterium]
MEALDHIGIVVNSSEEILLWEKLLGRSPFHVEERLEEGIKSYLFQVGSTRIELIQQDIERESKLPFLGENKEKIHHVAFYVEELSKECERLKEIGFIPLCDNPYSTSLGMEGMAFLPAGESKFVIEIVSFSNKKFT